MSRPGLRPIQPPFQKVPEILPRNMSSTDMKLTTQLHTVLRLSMSGAIPLRSLYASWRAEEQLHFLNRPILKRQLTINQLSCQI